MYLLVDCFKAGIGVLYGLLCEDSQMLVFVRIGVLHLNYSNNGEGMLFSSLRIGFCCYNCSTLLRRLYWTLFVFHEFLYRCFVGSLHAPFALKLNASTLWLLEYSLVLDTKFGLIPFCIEFFQVFGRC